MKFTETYKWLKDSERRANIIMHVKQPITATQCAKRVNLSQRICTIIMEELSSHGLLQCLNVQSWNGRLFWVTQRGRLCQNLLLQRAGKKPIKYDFPAIDWELYGFVVYDHRSAIIKALTEPMKPLQIRRKIRVQNPSVRINTNNVRDVLRMLFKKGIVKHVRIKNRVHPLYQLTSLGELIRRLLIQADNL